MRAGWVALTDDAAGQGGGLILISMSQQEGEERKEGRWRDLIVSGPVAPFPLPAPALFAAMGVEANDSTCSHREEEVEVELSLRQDSTCRVREETAPGYKVRK